MLSCSGNVGPTLPGYTGALAALAARQSGYDIQPVQSEQPASFRPGPTRATSCFSLARNSNILWVVAGTAPDAMLSTRENTQGGAQFIDYITEPDEYLAALDVFVQASHSEGLSLALLEAARYALPIVATKVGATECAFRDGKEAFLIAAKDPKRLAEKPQ